MARRWFGLLWGVLAVGCATETAPVLGPEDFPNLPVEMPVDATRPPHPPRNPALELLELGDPTLAEPIAIYRETGRPPVLRDGEQRLVRHPFGFGNPILVCKPLRVCDLMLEAGEQVLDVALGDSERWQTERAESGAPDARVPHVLFKPRLDGIATNAIVTTDRRAYHVGLVARIDETGANDGAYVRQLRFYYPEDLVERWTDPEARRRDERRAKAPSPPRLVPRRQFDRYVISGDDVPWRPLSVFDDGERVYLRMPAAMTATEAPGLWVVDRAGNEVLVNYRVREGHYIVDQLFGRARLALGVGTAAKAVAVTRLSPEPRAH